MRCVCGYGPEWHPGAGHCPLCSCGASPDGHLPVAVPAAPLLTWDGKQVHRCPGKPMTAAGKLPMLRRGSYREAAPQGRYQTRPAWGSILFPVDEVDPVEEEASEPWGPPQVPARPPAGPGELAGYRGRQALGMGRAAAAAGWTLAAYYARAHDGEEMSAIKMLRGALRAVATWTRPAGNIGKSSGWRADVAYGWIEGSMPQKVNHTDLEGYLNG